MSVTDDITDAIVEFCTGQTIKVFDRELVEEYLEVDFEKIVDEIVVKLKAKGIAIGT